MGLRVKGVGVFAGVAEQACVKWTAETIAAIQTEDSGEGQLPSDRSLQKQRPN